MNKSLLLLLLICLYFGESSAQITSSSLQGKVYDTTGEALPGATVLAIHTPTGTKYGRATQADGSYVLANLKTGGPYTIKVTFIGYDEQRYDNIYLSLGNTKRLNFELKESATSLEAIEVTAIKNDPFSNDKTGLSAQVSQKQLENTPTLNRSLQDVTRLIPQGSQSSFGGNNYRYNNLSIDGASSNDVLGFQEPASGASGSVASGTPGALAGTQPISLDAIQEVQIAMAPFDVRLGNFTGANINAVTRSGTNQWEGSIYGFGRNQLVTGTSVDDSRTPIANYHDFQTGMRLGGALKKNKLFVFANYEMTRRNEPVLNKPGDIGSNIPLSVVQQIANKLINDYNYDPGTFGDVSINRKSDKFFLRFDYNLGKNHQLTIRDNLVIASADNLERGANFLRFGNQGYTHNSRTNTLVAELKSAFGNNVSNHLIVGRSTVEDDRSYGGRVFPHIDIKYNTANTILAGTYREASIYGLTLNTTQFTDNLEIYKGRHTITLGTSNDLYNIEYRFLTAWNGRWEYKTVDNFLNDQPSRVRGVYNFENNDFDFNRNTPSADFRVFLLSLYGQDDFEVSDRLSLSFGLRIDMQLHPDRVPINPDVVNTPEFAHFDNKFGGVPQVNPRFGFNYKLNESDKLQIRGGSGLFTGRIPFAWYAYSHYISGTNYGNIDYKPTGELALTENLADLRSLQPNLSEINLVDNDFKLPRVWRSSLALDMKLKNDWMFTLEGVFTKSITDILFKSLNLKDETATFDGADGRSYFTNSGADKKVNPDFTNVFLLTNTSKGYRYNVTVNVSKEFKNNLYISGAYTFGESKDLVNGVRNSMAANFNRNQAISSNNPALTYSNFDIRHRIIAVLNYKKAWNESNSTSLNVVFTANSGSPYSFTYGGDLNQDGSSRNDLIYIPAHQDEILFKDIVDGSGNVLVSAATQWEQLDTYITNNNYLSANRGTHADRNGARTPWNAQLDLRLAHILNPKTTKGLKHRVEITLDVINFLNLVNRSWGIQKFVPNSQNSSFQLIDFEGVEDNTPVFQFKNPQGDPWQIDQLNSRWQAQLGLRYSF